MNVKIAITANPENETVQTLLAVGYTYCKQHSGEHKKQTIQLDSVS